MDQVEVLRNYNNLEPKMTTTVYSLMIATVWIVLGEILTIILNVLIQHYVKKIQHIINLEYSDK